MNWFCMLLCLLKCFGLVRPRDDTIFIQGVHDPIALANTVKRFLELERVLLHRNVLNVCAPSSPPHFNWYKVNFDATFWDNQATVAAHFLGSVTGICWKHDSSPLALWTAKELFLLHSHCRSQSCFSCLETLFHLKSRAYYFWRWIGDTELLIHTLPGWAYLGA